MNRFRVLFATAVFCGVGLSVAAGPGESAVKPFIVYPIEKIRPGDSAIQKSTAVAGETIKIYIAGEEREALIAGIVNAGEDPAMVSKVTVSLQTESFSGADSQVTAYLVTYIDINTGLDQHIAVPSLRLIAFREGAEDYEYLALISAAGMPDLADDFAMRMVRNARRWERKPEKYADIKAEMAQVLMETYRQ